MEEVNLMERYKRIRDVCIGTYVLIFIFGRMVTGALAMGGETISLAVTVAISTIQVLIGLTGCYYWINFPRPYGRGIN